ncbi:hypothetical protein DQ04_21601000 [Trypanosoma grayi]|uniref:hypothetical protein n=1 Tax=Trypanosoma grayi TaxID=71804 RepID=UPI0004F49DDA|nr:hypothetical protein DQ04_21601000 [Trypanosoma grayi]KEG05473.1 hypothetical protein DQ04_21601000 [Trypanosoma grayi]
MHVVALCPIPPFAPLPLSHIRACDDVRPTCAYQKAPAACYACHLLNRRGESPIANDDVALRLVRAVRCPLLCLRVRGGTGRGNNHDNHCGSRTTGDDDNHCGSRTTGDDDDHRGSRSTGDDHHHCGSRSTGDDDDHCGSPTTGDDDDHCCARKKHDDDGCTGRLCQQRRKQQQQRLCVGSRAAAGGGCGGVRGCVLSGTNGRNAGGRVVG